MSDFFDSLASRSRAAAPALRPRAAARFESRSGDAFEVATEVAADSVPAPRDAVPVLRLSADAQPVRPAEARAARGAADPSPEFPAPERIIVRDVVLAPEAQVAPEERAELAPEVMRAQIPARRLEETPEETREERILRVHHLFAVDDSQAAESASDPGVDSVSAIDTADVTTQSPGDRPPAPPLASPRAPRPLPRVRPRQQPEAPRDRMHGSMHDAAREPHPGAAERPVVHVTIGRVEVRAVHPQQPAPRPAPPPAASGPTLQEFLEQRERRT